MNFTPVTLVAATFQQFHYYDHKIPLAKTEFYP